MKRFDKNGMMVFPNPLRKSQICKGKELLVIEQCFCHNGHNLISDRAVFNGFNGIMLRASRGKQSGLVALSPVYGYKSRVSLDLKFNSGEIWEISCPVCNQPLPVYSECDCGGKLFVLFLNPNRNFSNAIILCNRIDCFNAEIKLESEMHHYPGGYMV